MIAAALLLAALGAAAAPAADQAKPAKGDGVYVAGDAPKPKLKRPIKATLHAAARDWEPLGLYEAGDPGQASNAATVRLVKREKGTSGKRSRSRAWARSYGDQYDGWLVITIAPESLAERRKHFELRFRVVEGYVEKAEAAVLTVGKPGAPAGADRATLRRLGLAFGELGPSSGEVTLSAFDPRPGKAGKNSGRLRALFADPFVGFVDLSWLTSGTAP